VTIRVALADDHPMYRFGLTARLGQTDTLDVIASVASGEELLVKVNELSPDVVITDLTMPGIDGADLVQKLTRTWPALPVLVLTMHEDDQHVLRALRAGARGYLVKGADGAEIVRAVESVHAGASVYGAPVAGRIAARVALDPPARVLADLTPRETEVLEELVAGRRNREIGRRLGMSEKTVRNHVSQLLAKLHAPDRTAAADMAREAGLGAVPD
jgi:DNA-binding NarL/FixJ family response regulator